MEEVWEVGGCLIVLIRRFVLYMFQKSWTSRCFLAGWHGKKERSRLSCITNYCHRECEIHRTRIVILKSSVFDSILCLTMPAAFQRTVFRYHGIETSPYFGDMSSSGTHITPIRYKLSQTPITSKTHTPGLPNHFLSTT